MNIADLFGGVFVPRVVINPWMQAKRPHCVLSLTACLPAQRVSSSPSQGRRPWKIGSKDYLRPNGPTVQRSQGLMDGIVGPLGLPTVGAGRSPARLAGLGERLARWAARA